MEKRFSIGSVVIVASVQVVAEVRERAVVGLALDWGRGMEEPLHGVRGWAARPVLGFRVLAGVTHGGSPVELVVVHLGY